MKKYGLLGEKLSHSYSPEIHSMLSDYEYKLYEVERDKLDDFFANCELDGFNVTVPYKREVMKYLVGISDTAKLMGSVNTVVRRPDGFWGDNTDAYGFEYAVRKSGIEVGGKKALVLGSGGASGMAVKVLESMGAGKVVVISRSGVDNYTNLERHYDADIIVNTTPVGMYPSTDEAPLDLAPFKSLSGVVDIIYNPAKTALLAQADELHIPYINGLTMLVAQAKCASELFLGDAVEETLIDSITKLLEFRMKNIILVGMPGSGKSTVAEKLAKMLGRELFDSDTEIEAATGMKIPYIIENFGEAEFRRHETEALKKLCSGSGRVIATGGGCITTPENYKILHQNANVIWIKRELSRLATNGRPLSARDGVEELYARRRPLYEKFADFEVDNNKTPKATAERIVELLR